MIIKNPYAEVVNNYKRSQIIKSFPILQNPEYNNFVNIHKYLSHIPERFYNEEVFSLYFNWLQLTDVKYHKDLVNYFSKNENHLSIAIRNINQINELKIHDEDLKGNDDYNLLEVIDTCINPNYLKLIEGVFAVLLHLVAYFSRIIRNAGVEKLDVFNIVEEINSNFPELQILVQAYHHVVRNSIAHGSVEYLNNEIRYSDKNNSEVLYYADIITVFDELLDYCNAMILALKIFFTVQNNNEYKFPLSFLIDEIKAQTENKWLKVNNCIAMTVHSNKSQLLIYSYVRTSDKLKVNYFMIQIANIAESLMPGYDRYFITFKSNCAYPGWYSFSGEKLAKARMSAADDYVPFVNAIDESGVFFHPKIKLPKIFYKIDSFIESFLINFRIERCKFKNEYKRAKVLIPNYEIHRNSISSVINADIVLTVNDNVDITAYIRNNHRKLVRYACKHGKCTSKQYDFAKMLPLGFARISIYSKLMRKRTFKNYGLGKDLICVIQYRKLSRIHCPAIYGSSLEEYGLFRIEWNYKYLNIRKE